MLRSVAFPVLFALPLFGLSQQVADTTFKPPVLNPAYSVGRGPTIFIDEAHNNFHTRNGRFTAFTKLVERDGYNVKSSAAPFTPEVLSGCKVMVIANALDASNTAEWVLPNPSAFTDAEIANMNEWVKNGGALFLIADHMPFPGAAEKLAASFGFKFYNGFATKNGGTDIFKPGHGLMQNIITTGRNQQESIRTLQTFTGQAFEIPSDAKPIVVLNSKYKILMPDTAWKFKENTPSRSADGLAQGAFKVYGRGRVVVFGEAAMFTAQISAKGSKMGMNVDSASQNPQFLLNVVHWLDQLID
ncbi:MAG TPA: DUF4350 domain-containing protein [Cyclobacteriaceae bacterium]|nr:DUF4350 domain-containing protein [Cyclobacteriaceae bacterium]